jgi:4a-hydroxytetrahydrobiopterin dehydratase
MQLSEKEINASLNTILEWERVDSTIRRTFIFNNFSESIMFVDKVAALAESVSHHPDIDIRWNKVTLVLTTHDEGGISEKDIEMAKQINAIQWDTDKPKAFSNPA